VIHRATSVVLLLGGAVLLFTWVSAPAAPVPQAAPVVAGSTRTRALPADATLQIERLRQRRAATPPYRPPARDPFHFSGPPASSRVAPAPNVPAAPAAPALPRLIAIVANDTDSGAARRIVVSDGVGVKVVATGDRLGPFVVGAIGASDAELLDPATGATFRISIR
jgi:hypothetical protein